MKNAPKALVENGLFNHGKFKTPFQNVNFQESNNPYFFSLDLVKNIQTREWQAFQIDNTEYFIMIAIYNAKKMALLQCIIFDKKENKKLKYEAKVSPFKINISNGFNNTLSSYNSPKIQFNIQHEIFKNLLEIKINWKAEKQLPNLNLHIQGEHNTSKYEPLVVCLPFNDKRAMYSHKCLMPAFGTLKLNNDTIQFHQKTTSIIIDDHKGYYPFITRYNWLTALGFDNEKRIGINITHNQAKNPEQYNENCIWIDGKIHNLPFCTFEFLNDEQNTWKISDIDQKVQLVFTPKVHNYVTLNLLLFQSKYYGPYGVLKGNILLENGQKIIVEQLFAMGEKFYLRL